MVSYLQYACGQIFNNHIIPYLSAVRNTAILSNDSDAATGDMQQRIRILNSKVISASLGKGRHIQLSQPITLVLKHLKTENVSNPTCVFWNYIDQ